MKYFTNNPLERLMMQTPKGFAPEPTTPPPEGHHCFGCSRWGQACVRPCYRDIKAKALDTKSPPSQRNGGFERD